MVNPVEMVERLQIQASSQSDRLAIIDACRHQSISFAQLNDAVAMAATQFATQFQAFGIRTTATVLIVLPTSVQRSIEYWIMCIGLLKIGATPHWVDPAVVLSPSEHNCTFPPADVLITSWKTHFLKVRSPILRQIPMQFTIGFPLPGTNRLTIQGWTGGVRPAPSSTEREIDLVTQPTAVLANLSSGITSLILGKPADRWSGQSSGTMKPAKVIRQIQQYQPQTLTAAPVFLEQLATYSEQHALKLSSFRRISSDGAPMVPRLLDRLQTIAPQAEVISVYGLTAPNSIAQVTYRQIQMTEIAAMSAGKGLLVGYPNPDLSLKIIRERSDPFVSALTNQAFVAQCLPSRSIGKIVVKGEVRSDTLPKIPSPSSFQVDGVSWYSTGEVGYLDEQGYLWLMGQCDTRIVDEQGVLYPFAVEVAASFHDGVQRTVVDHQQGRRVLQIELKRSVARDAKAREACLNTLKLVLGWANIQDYQVVDRLPE
ncbi:AMP-binding protein [Egbenema bharatensis]|uniref:AMP-binding protein n=1 Tax=Egbenema bharatensis TaxID=3463334 RepID=UPI003A8A5935